MMTETRRGYGHDQIKQYPRQNLWLMTVLSTKCKKEYWDHVILWPVILTERDPWVDHWRTPKVTKQIVQIVPFPQVSCDVHGKPIFFRQ